MSKGGIQFDPKAASLIMREEVERARQLIINHIRINGQNASGRTIASLKVEQPSEDETILGDTSHLGFLRLDEGLERYHTASVASSVSG